MKGRCKLHKKLLSLFFYLVLSLIIFSFSAYADDNTTTKVKGIRNFKFMLADNETNGASEDKTTPPAVDISQPFTDPVNNNIVPSESPSEDDKIPLPSDSDKKPSTPKPPAANNQNSTGAISKNPLENFINSKKLTSSSKYLVWINTSTQRTYIFTGSIAGWKLYKTFICATGKDSTPTIKGIFKAGAKAYFVYDSKYHCYLKYVTRIYNGYLMHSVILNSKGQVIDGTLGRKKSHGCVRLSLKDSEWIYTNIPTGTTILIN